MADIMFYLRRPADVEKAKFHPDAVVLPISSVGGDLIVGDNYALQDAPFSTEISRILGVAYDPGVPEVRVLATCHEVVVDYVPEPEYTDAREEDAG